MTRSYVARAPDVSGCCGTSPQASDIIDHIGRGLARRRRDPLPIRGNAHADADDRYARFTIAVSNGVVTDVVFHTTACVTLVAYCERLADLVTGERVGRALEIGAADLVASFPQVPPSKHGLSRLAAASLHDALARAAEGAGA